MVGHPPADRWEVQVAWVEPSVVEAVLHPDIPTSSFTVSPRSTNDHGRNTKDVSPTVAAIPPLDLDRQATDAARKAAGFTPIPSPGLAWGSAQVDGTWRFQNPTRIGSPLVFPVVEERGDWLRVMFPARPNQQTAWIARDDVKIQTHNWHIEVDVTENRMRVWQGDVLEVDTAIVAGTAYTRTPLGRFYINEMQQQDSPYGAYGSWILATNGFSDVMERFSGEVPMFALHGTPYPETMGQDLSNGCIRMPNDIVERLAAEVPVGTPVDIVE